MITIVLPTQLIGAKGLAVLKALPNASVLNGANELDAIELEIERARRLSVADPGTKREFYRMLAVRESVRATPARSRPTHPRSATL